MSPRILVVDERPEMHALMRYLFRRGGVTILSAFDANEAMSLAVTQGADVVVLDLDILSSDGVNMCEQLEADSRTRDIAAVFVTRPIDPDDLHARVRTALREKRERDALLAETELDPSSGVGNARAFERRLAAQVTAHQALGEQSGLVYVELDPLDAREHHVDTAVPTTAAVLAASVRSGDGVFQIGAEKFAILLPGANLDGARRVVERLRRRLACVDMEYEGSSLKITASFGVTATSQFRGRVSCETMKNAADKALQLAHQVGRGCIVIDAAKLRAS